MVVPRLKINHEIAILTIIFLVLGFLDILLILGAVRFGIIAAGKSLILGQLFTPVIFGVLRLILPVVVVHCWFIRNRNLWLAVFVLWLTIAVTALTSLAHGYFLLKSLS